VTGSSQPAKYGSCSDDIQRVIACEESNISLEVSLVRNWLRDLKQIDTVEDNYEKQEVYRRKLPLIVYGN
jgi:hypothetical protein